MSADTESDRAVAAPAANGEAPLADPAPPAELAPPAEEPAQEPAEISFADASPAMVVLSYLWIFCLVPLFAEPHDRAVRWHAVHGLVLVIAETIGSLAVLFLGAVVAGVMPAAVSDLVSLVRSVLGPAVLVLHAILIVDGVRGRGWRVPLITRYAERILGEAPREVSP